MDSRFNLAATLKVILVANFLLVHSASSQDTPTNLRPKADVMVGRNSRSVTAGLDWVARDVRASVVEIFDMTQQHLCLGTLVSLDGLIVTKASELRGTKHRCRFQDGTLVEVQLVARSEENDLALLTADLALPSSAADQSAVTPIAFGQHDPLQPGSVVVCVDSRDNQPRLGVISIAGRSFTVEDPECTDCIDIGLKCKTVTRLVQTTNQWSQPTTVYTNMLVVERVYPRTIAEEGGVLKGDLVDQVNGRRINSQLELAQVAKGLQPGETVTFLVWRQGRPFTLAVAVPRHSKRIYHDRWGGGPFNRRRFGFQNVLTHDIPIHPDQCGSPLINLNGQFLGINIARSLRVATLAVPVDQVREFVLTNRPDAKLSMSSEPFRSATVDRLDR